MAYRIIYYNQYLPEKTAITAAVNNLNSAMSKNVGVADAREKLDTIIKNLNYLNSHVYEGDKSYPYVPSVYKYNQERELVKGRVDTLKTAIANTKNQQLINDYGEKSNINIDTSYSLPKNDAELMDWIGKGWNYPGASSGGGGGGGGGGDSGGGGGSVDNTPKEPSYPSAIDISTDAWNVAAKAYAQYYGVSLPDNFRDIIKFASETQPSSNKQKDFAQAVKDRVIGFRDDKNGYYQTALYGAGLKYQHDYLYRTDTLRDKILKSDAESIQSIAKSAVKDGVSVDDVKSKISEGADKSINDYNARKPSGGGDWFDTVFNVAAPVVMAIATDGLSLPQQLAVNAGMQLAGGANLETVLKSSLAQLASNQVPTFLDSVGATVNNVAIQSAIDNASRQVVNAAITGQDLGKAALAGAAGGIVVGSTGEIIDSNAIRKAAGEYVQAVAAGFPQEAALVKALGGFASQSAKDAVSSKVTEEGNKELQSKAGVNWFGYPVQTTPQFGAEQTTAGGERISPTGDVLTSGDRTLTPVEVTARAEPDYLSTSSDYYPADQNYYSPNKSLAPVTVTAKREPDLLSISEAPSGDTGKEETEKQKTTSAKNQRILLSLLNQPETIFLGGGSSSAGGGATGGFKQGYGGGPSSQALAQALRLGDPGLAYLGGDKEGKRRNVWNTASLKVKDETGA